MDEEASRQAGRYIISDIPSLLIFGLLDIDRNFLASFEYSEISMYCEMASPFMHVIFVYLFVIKWKFEIIGCGMA